MGDRCNVNLTIRKQDEKIWEEAGVPFSSFDYLDLSAENPDWLEGELYEMNYAGYEELERAALLGAKFFGDHGAGGDYGATRFVINPKTKKVLYIATDGNGNMAVSLNETTGKPLWGENARVQRYLKLMRTAHEWMADKHKEKKHVR